MNILFISPSSPRESIGGVERYINNLIEFCKNQSDIKAKIFLPTYGEEYIEEDGNVTLFFNNDIAILKDTSISEISRKARLFADKVEKIINDDEIDIICAENIHLGLPPAYSILLNMVSVIHKIPIVLRLHSFATTELQRELINQLMWRRISCVSISVAGDCFTKGADINILSTEYLGVNTQEFNTKKRPPKIREQLNLTNKNKIILTACRIIDDQNNILAAKGVINLIESFSKISSRYPDLRLVIAVAKAPKSLETEFNGALEMLKGYVQLRNVAKQTIIKIFSLDEMAQVYQESDLFVLASENETFGQVFVESMACGLPVIGTKVGGIPEIISDSYNGYLVLPNDASVLAQKIEIILNNRSIRDSFIKTGNKTIQEKFTLEKQFSSFMEMLKKLIEK
jgi:glycosyltransferase involved in cell wall biosynthesis